MDIKSSAGGVMSAIKSRGDVGSAKKGVKLLNIVQKLTDKREAAKKEEAAEEKPETAAAAK